MTLATLKTKLQVLTGTSIGQVLFDWQEYLNEVATKTYPVVLWSLNGAKFKKDARTTSIQKIKTITLTAFIITSFDGLTQDKITVWDTIEGYFDIYLNAMNNTAGIQIQGIEEISGEYYPEGLLSVDSEVGIGYQVTIKMFC